ncbi:MAG: AMP-binding protein, partial [Bdellovibrionales bacterium]|nr:AMP-binding protein [Bdellovibrionales bacterium]
MVADRARDMPQVPQTLLIPVGRALSDAITLLAGISLGHTVCPTPADATEREKEKYGLALSPASGGFSVLFTSGTTGDPKAVRLGLEQWRASSHAFAAYHRINPGDAWLLSIPLYHAGGFAILMRALLLGMRVAIPETASTEELRRWMEDERLLGVSVVPTVLRRILDSGPVRLRGRKKILVGGAPAPRALMERAL